MWDRKTCSFCKVDSSLLEREAASPASIHGETPDPCATGPSDPSSTGPSDPNSSTPAATLLTTAAECEQSRAVAIATGRQLALPTVEAAGGRGLTNDATAHGRGAPPSLKDRPKTPQEEADGLPGKAPWPSLLLPPWPLLALPAWSEEETPVAKPMLRPLAPDLANPVPSPAAPPRSLPSC